MRGNSGKIKNLVKLHTILWYLLIAWFALASGLYLFKVGAAEYFALAGVIMTIAVTILRLAVMSEQFRRAGNARFQSINYLLILIILITIIFKRFL